jgi:hypothetical protein
MEKMLKARSAFLLLSVCGLTHLQAEAGVCVDCHDTPPVSADHIPVETLNAVECMACHSATGTDMLFRHLHNHHMNLGMACESCHNAAPDVLLLRELLEDRSEPSP